jgi:hypothetical protein
MLYLRQATASQSLLIGPFIDETDGISALTGLTIANTDIRLSANGGNIAAKNSGGGTHDELGYYTITLDATDTATVGRLQLMVHAAGALPVWESYQVLEEAIYDALFAASATGLLPANVTQFGGSNGTFSGGRPEINLSHWKGTAPADLISQRVDVTVGANQNNVITTASINDGAFTAAKFASGAFDAVWSVTTRILTAATNLPSASDIATAVWAAGTRLLTAGTNIVLAKGTGVTGFNDISSSDAQTAAAAALTAYDPPTEAEMNARTLAAASYATASALATVQSDTNDIQTRLPAALSDGRMPADMQAINGEELTGDGSEGDKFGPAA